MSNELLYEGVPHDPHKFLQFLKEETEYARVFYFIAKKKATFFSEICEVTGLEERKVKRIMAQLRESGHIERISVTMDSPDPRILSRRKELFNRGMTGIYRWSQIGWHGVKNDGTYLIFDSADNMMYPDGTEATK